MTARPEAPKRRAPDASARTGWVTERPIQPAAKARASRLVRRTVCIVGLLKVMGV